MKRFYTIAGMIVAATVVLVYLLVPGGRQYEIQPIESFATHEEAVTCAVFTPDLKYAVVFHEAAYIPGDKLVTAWDLENQTAIYELKVRSVAALQKLTLSPDGSVFAAATVPESSPQLSLYETRSGTRLVDLPLHKKKLSGTAFSPGGKKLLTIERDDRFESYANIWNWRKQERLGCFLVKGIAAAFTPDGDGFLTAHRTGAEKEHEVHVWDANTGVSIGELARAKMLPEWLLYSPDGSLFVMAGMPGVIRVLEVDTGKVVNEFQPFPGRNRYPCAVALSPDGTKVAAGFRFKPQIKTTRLLDELRRGLGPFSEYLFAPPDLTAPVAVWDIESGKLLHFLGVNRFGVHLRFSPDGKQLATIDYDGNIHWWDV